MSRVFQYAADKYQPSYGASLSKKPKVIVHQFGSGYQQRSREGLNTNLESWSLTFKLSPEEGETAMNLLDSWAGVSNFSWTNPRGNTLVYVCPEYGFTYNEGWYELTATFNQVPETAS